MDAWSELLVVDSASRGPETRLAADVAGARYVGASRPGLDVARNLAWRAANGTIIAYIDDDAVAAPEWLGPLRQAFADPTVACVTGRVLPLELRTEAQRYFEERYSFDRGADPIRFSVSSGPRWLTLIPWQMGSGCNMAFRRGLFDVIGPFDEALDVGTPTGGGGELDIFRRLLRAGFVAAYTPQAVVYHQHRESMKALYRQAWGYGKSFTALMTKSIVVERDMRLGAALLVGHECWMRARAICQRLVRRRGSPLGLILAESLGYLAGPLAYLVSLWGAKQGNRHSKPSAPGFDGPVDRGLQDAAGLRQEPP
jgi:glycosyltransferase involved in cell wall biosynthesis